MVYLSLALVCNSMMITDACWTFVCLPLSSWLKFQARLNIGRQRQKEAQVGKTEKRCQSRNDIYKESLKSFVGVGGAMCIFQCTERG